MLDFAALDAIAREPAQTKADRDAMHRARLRVTAPRLAVLSAVRGGEHWTTEQIATRARAQLGSVSTQAVYDALAALTGAGLIRRIEPAGSAARFETRVGDNHHHLVCRRCGIVVDAACAPGAAPCLAPSDAAGFLVDEAEVTFWGLCPRCRAAEAGAVGERAA
ncbi:MAG: Fur family transcriptional regulator [Solirubrobacteraceae bacterium]